MPHSETYDVVLIGGGIVGLSLAYHLAGRRLRVCLIERGELGKEASWAGAGIVPPGAWYNQHPAIEDLVTVSRQLYPSWSDQLAAETGIDNGWRVCGAVYVCDSRLADQTGQRLERWRQAGIQLTQIAADRLEEFGLNRGATRAPDRRAEQAIFHVPDEAQLRNPRHLAALTTACQKRGVRLLTHTHVRRVDHVAGHAQRIVTDRENLSCGHACICAGCWSSEFAAELGLQVPIRPVRGQMVLLQGGSHDRTLISHLHYEDRYIVPRNDGRVLVGSTVEDVGFDQSTTADGIRDLLAFGADWGLGDMRLEKSWAGLRPITADDRPLIGRLPTFENVWLASGHGRAGIQMAPATAVALAATMDGQPPPIDLESLSPARF